MARLPHETSLKEALHASVFDSETPAKVIADKVGLDYAALQKFCANGEPSHLPLRRLPALVEAADNHALLDFLEGLAGRIAFKLPAASGLGKNTGHATKEFGEFLEAVGDHDMTPETAARIVSEGEDVLRSVAAVMEQAKRLVAATAKGPRAVGES